ncbi:MAG: DNA polymerase/3'-5' exonuclease PolX [Bacillota bacterium]
MKNLELAQQFERIASLLEIVGESPFKIRAYRRVARTLIELPEPVEEVARQGRLRELPGVGEAISSKIEEWLSTGKMGLLERLQQQVPEGLAELMEIPGIGARTAGLLYERLGVASLAELEAAARAGKVRQIKGMGARTEAAILEGIERFRKRAGRQPMPYLLAAGEALAAGIKGLAGVQAVNLAGSLRRAEEMATDVDLVVAGPRVEQTAEAVRAYLGAGVQEQAGPWPGTVRIRGKAPGGTPVDVWVVPLEAVASALFLATGPAAHVEAVTARLSERGWRWEAGRLACTREADRDPANPAWPQGEEEIYARAGLPWIAPELRWGLDEVDLAARGELPRRLVELSDIQGDLHVHTVASDGVAPPEAMVEGARDRGLSYLAITDHSPSLTVARGLSAERLAAHAARIRGLSHTLGFPVLAGSEVDIRPDGTLDYPDEVLAGLDWVVASIHSHFRLDAEATTRRLVAACEHPLVHALGHPSGRLLGRRDPYAVDLEAVLRRAAETGTAVEINATPDRLDLNADWARRARAMGVKFVIGTDAHSPAQLAFMGYGVLVARRAGLCPGDVLNTGDIDALRRYALRRRA